MLIPMDEILIVPQRNSKPKCYNEFSWVSDSEYHKGYLLKNNQSVTIPVTMGSSIAYYDITNDWGKYKIIGPYTPSYAPPLIYDVPTVYVDSDFGQSLTTRILVSGFSLIFLVVLITIIVKAVNRKGRR